MAITIVIGPDGSGKTTLINRLHGLSKHFDKPSSSDTPRSYFDLMVREIEDCSPDAQYIFDRFFYCEMAYGPAMRGRSLITLYEMLCLEEILKEHKAVIIFCDDNIFKLWKRCKERGEDYVPSLLRLWRIQRMYRRIIKETTLPVLRYRVCKNVPV